MKKIVSLLILFLVAATVQSCGSSTDSSGGGGGGGGSGGREWTYMVYVAGDNSLSEAAFTDLGEMESVGSNADVAIVVEAEFSSAYSDTSLDSTYHCYVEGDDDGCVDMSDGDDIGNVDMASSAELQAFIEWAIDTYPADNYALTIWDHGAGWKNYPVRGATRGAVQDETSGTFMSLPQLADAVAAAQASTGITLNVIDFDACLMAMYEVAYEFNGLVDYMVFSEETEPGDGNPYDTILTALKASPSSTPAELSASIVEKYDAFFDGGGATTLSAVDMSQLGALDTAVLALSAALNADATSTAVIDAAADGGTIEYAYPDNHDLYALADYLITNMPSTDVATAAAAVKTAVTGFVIANETNDASMSDSVGVAIWLPLVSEASAGDLADYALLASNAARTFASGTWGDFVNTYFAASGGTPLSETTGDFSVKITWTNASGGACDADVDLWMFEPVGGDYYTDAPYLGPTANNGSFSSDSHVNCYDADWTYTDGCSDYSAEETFEANADVSSGRYYFLANYTGNGDCTAPLVHYYVQESGGEFAEVDSETLDGTDPYDSSFSGSTYSQFATYLDGYSDWWSMGTVDRAYGSSSLSGGLVTSKSSGGLLLNLKKR